MRRALKIQRSESVFADGIFLFNLAELRNTASKENFCLNYKTVNNKMPLEIHQIQRRRLGFLSSI